MIYFLNDYSVFAAGEIIEKLNEYAGEHYVGYGLDALSDSAREKLHSLLKDDGRCDIHFMVGGTQANQVMINGMLKPYQAVIAVDSGHINVHECGAIEANGHKVETIKAVNGKMDVGKLRELVESRDDEHMVQFGAVYISQSTELGTVYSRQELLEIRKICHEHGLYLYIDGARLGVALTAAGADLQLSDLVDICDCFYIGATKNGGMLGEAMVVVNDELKPHFRSLMKHHGALLAKGMLAGLQFDCLFTDDLYFRLARNSNETAMKLKKGLEDLGVKFLIDSPTNQQFPILPNEVICQLENEFVFYQWEKGPSDTILRLVTSFSTTEEEVECFLEAVRTAMKK